MKQPKQNEEKQTKKGPKPTDSTKKVPKEKSKKDPNAPKRPLTAFLLFSGEFRKSVQTENPSFKMTDIARELGSRWRDLGEADKQKYTKMAAEEKEKYDRAVA
eukprot:NODE_2929_length_445_cov_148.669192_g2322_i0.p2 GENE.NODE_2929_length_445_cov_148.669192_g2322_i0~~NODE_2929_length_445_cov_148.669192_g2322_i0.p2  ORF type:complete len:103 (-),score=13.04 NODE_2929_length_445_cov_148.669192_g2322_i0:82-390(-)